MACKILVFLLIVCAVHSAFVVNISEDEVSFSSKHCDRNVCFEKCAQQGYDKSWCYGAKCFCNKLGKSLNAVDKLTAEDDQISQFQALSRRLVKLDQCDSSQCNVSCQSQNYPGGVCIFGTCFCYL